MIYFISRLKIYLLCCVFAVGLYGCSKSLDNSIDSPSKVNELFVSADALLGGDGSKTAPFLTLDKARDALRELRETDSLESGPFTIWIREGVYFRNTTLLLEDQDSGSTHSPIIFRGYPNEIIRINGGIIFKASDAYPVIDQDVRSQLDSIVRNSILEIDLNTFGDFNFERLTDYFSGSGTDIKAPGVEIFYNDTPMKLASWPNDGWASIKSLPTGPLSGLFGYEDAEPSTWSNISDIKLYGYWRYDWFANYESISSINIELKQIQTNYVPPANPYGFLVGQRWKAINVLEELDQPGEFYLERQSGKLFFFPIDDNQDSNVSISILETPLVKMENTEFITFRDIIFENTRGVGVEINGGNNNLVAGCVIKNIGTVGIAVGGMVSDILWKINYETVFAGSPSFANGVQSCDIYNTGYGGVLIGGGDRLDLTHAGNFAINNHIYNYSRLNDTDRPAIFLYGVGNHIAHNRIHDGPDLALTFWGNEHLIEYNEIYDVVQKVNDAGAIKIGGDFSQRGTKIQFNYIHDLVGDDSGGMIGVYLDDFQSDTLIFGNVFERVNRAINIGGGHENIVENNIFYDSPQSFYLDARGMTWNVKWFDGGNNLLLDRLNAVDFTGEIYSAKYPSLANLYGDDPAVPKGNKLIRNIFSFSGDPVFLDNTENNTEILDNFFDDYPGYLSDSPISFTLDSGAYPLQNGFIQIPMNKIGLRIDDYRLTTE